MKKILIAEDDGALRNMYAHKLEPEFEIVEAKSGALTLKMIKNEKPDLVILDLQFPDMSGIDVLKALKEDGVLEKLKVVVLTNLVDEETVQKALKLGAREYLKKETLELSQLHDVCVKHLGGAV